MSDDLNKKQLQCRQQHSIAVDQFRELLEKIEAIEPPPPPKKKQRLSEKPEGVPPSAPTAESERAAVMELVETVCGCLKKLDVDMDIDMEELAGPSGPSVGDK